MWLSSADSSSGCDRVASQLRRLASAMSGYPCVSATAAALVGIMLRRPATGRPPTRDQETGAKLASEGGSASESGVIRYEAQLNGLAPPRPFYE